MKLFAVFISIRLRLLSLLHLSIFSLAYLLVCLGLKFLICILIQDKGAAWLCCWM